jgi:hypothetical protein
MDAHQGQDNGVKQGTCPASSTTTVAVTEQKRNRSACATQACTPNAAANNKNHERTMPEMNERPRHVGIMQNRRGANLGVLARNGLGAFILFRCAENRKIEKNSK